MQESFGCVVANRFHQLLDDESDPFDILREAERRRQQQLQRKRRDEAAAAAAAAAGAGPRGGRSPAGPSGHRAGAGGRRESQKERKTLPAPGAQGPDSPGGGLQAPEGHGAPRCEAGVPGQGRAGREEKGGDHPFQPSPAGLGWGRYSGATTSKLAGTFSILQPSLCRIETRAPGPGAGGLCDVGGLGDRGAAWAGGGPWRSPAWRLCPCPCPAR
ncbi:hypothetical protein P7K49_000637 [Saguinus oedipus]|uniref:Intracellular hyaluronan-binding protein 4 N-terminal domain-containing protein n=1 Tax=Saguinus oedipus TaxID=9490 RepID=A0ABQ9WCC0_SAGOE|nr:hypothetical protein P7K49_000637 [Saguinus oedipus]